MLFVKIWSNALWLEEWIHENWKDLHDDASLRPVVVANDDSKSEGL